MQADRFFIVFESRRGHWDPLNHNHPIWNTASGISKSKALSNQPNENSVSTQTAESLVLFPKTEGQKGKGQKVLQTIVNKS